LTGHRRLMTSKSRDHPLGSISAARSPAKHRLSLRWRLMLLVVTAVVPLLVFVLGYQYSEYRQDIDATGDQLLTLARSMAQLVDVELQARISALETLATSSALESGDLDRFRARASAAADKFPGSNILLYDAASCGRVTLEVLGAADDLLPLGSNVVDLGL
jgi:hypothetical protein